MGLLGTVVVVLAVTTVLAACSSGSGSAAGGADGTSPGTTRPARSVPDGPAATVGPELTGGDGPWMASVVRFDATDGREVHEYAVSGTAASYAGGPIPLDGRVTLTPTGSAEYTTRIVVDRPTDPADANGTVVVEWLNVSSGMDSAPDHSFLADELTRTGTTWVGVSAQHIGVEGGEVAVASGSEDAGKGLVSIDPARYGELSHPGDAYAYDIYTQVGRTVRAGGDLLGGIEPEVVLAVGESQSAFALTTYADGVQPLAGVYDGFLLHSRGGAPLELGEPGTGASISTSIFGPPARIRTDLDVPVLIVETETDVTSVLGYHAARQDDTDRIRLWELAGTAHADAFTVGPLADLLPCGAEINDGPQRFSVRAALRALDTWVRTGEAPPTAPRLEVDTSSGSAVIVRDADGNALGGVRLPQVEVPVAALTGEPGPTGGTICLLLGTTLPFPPERLAARYPSVEEYQRAYEEATDAAIGAGFALGADRQQILDDADPAAVAAALG